MYDTVPTTLSNANPVPSLYAEDLRQNPPMSVAATSRVRVGVRIRPLSAKEASEGGVAVVDGRAFDRVVSLSKRTFTYDSVFGPGVSQAELYGDAAPPLLDAFLGGYNATVIAYGQVSPRDHWSSDCCESQTGERFAWRTKTKKRKNRPFLGVVG